MSGYGTANTWSTGPTNPPSWAPKQPTQQQLDILKECFLLMIKIIIMIYS